MRELRGGWIAALALALMWVTPGLWAAPHSGCLRRAADHFDLPVLLLTAIRQQEGGEAGSLHRNTNGSVDYGVMQINSIWLPRLETAGYTASILRWDACYNIMAGAWILARAMHDEHVWRRRRPGAVAFWRAVGAYHSRTPRLNRAYAQKIWRRYQGLRQTRRLVDTGNSAVSER